MSASTTSIAGGVGYNHFATRAVGPYYTFYLIDTSKDLHSRGRVDTRGIFNTPYKKVGDITQDLDMQHVQGKPVSKLCIGKTSTHARKNKTLNPTDRATFRTSDGISQRWHEHKKEKYGKGGMVVFAVITEKDVEQTNFRGNTEELALKIEETLWKKFKGDLRLHVPHEAYQPGPTGQGADGYPLYMAIARRGQRWRRKRNKTNNN